MTENTDLERVYKYHKPSESAERRTSDDGGKDLTMHLCECSVEVDPFVDMSSFKGSILDNLEKDRAPVRVAVTSMSDDCRLTCELGVLKDESLEVRRSTLTRKSIFGFSPRMDSNHDTFNVVFIVPTGIGAIIGGHAGDAAPVARLFASVCDTLITHPNVVNGSDINELPENGLYVEGSVLCRLLMGTVGLNPVRSNRVLVVMDKHEDKEIRAHTVNAVSAAKATFGMDCPLILEMERPIGVAATYLTSGRASGVVTGFDRLYAALRSRTDEFDAVAITTKIGLSEELHKNYFLVEAECVNPWGGVGALLTHTVSTLLNVPSAHAPMASSVEELNWCPGVVDPRKAAEVISISYFYSVLKGLHRSPRIVDLDCADPELKNVLTVADVHCVVIPDGCIGLPVLAALEQEIPVIAVRENSNQMKNDLTRLPFKSGGLIVVDTYLDAVGVVSALKSGVCLSSVRRPLGKPIVEVV